MREILKLEAIAELSEKEAHIAIQFHETWRPSAFNRAVHKRISFSYAAHTFEIVRKALSRELLMSLSRLWIPQQDAIALTKATDLLKNPKVFDALRDRYRAQIGGDESSEHHLTVLFEKRQEYFGVINRYQQGGDSASILARLKHLRHNELAHRKLEINDVIKPSEEQIANQTSNVIQHIEVEQLYQDSLKAVSLLNELVLMKNSNLIDITNVYKHHSEFFWEGLQSEREAGHPRYIAPKE